MTVGFTIKKSPFSAGRVTIGFDDMETVRMTVARTVVETVRSP